MSCGRCLAAVLAVLAACTTVTGTRSQADDAKNVADVADPGGDPADAVARDAAPEEDVTVADPGTWADDAVADVPEAEAEAEALAAEELIPDEGADAAELPQGDVCTCAGKECGDDGCGHLCGYCPGQETCQNGRCSTCVPDCKGKVCGDNGCNLGVDCAPGCGAGYECDAGACNLIPCTPDCTNKECGTNGCPGGGVCGTCGCGRMCGAQSTCEASPCNGVSPTTGACDGNTQEICSGYCTASEALFRLDCTQNTDGKTWCGYDTWTSMYDCTYPPACQPVCHDPADATKLYVCGNGGCTSGSATACGQCTDGWDCQLTLCHPNKGAPCGPVPQAGKCFDGGATVFACDPTQGVLVETDCGTGLTCQYNDGAGLYQCR